MFKLTSAILVVGYIALGSADQLAPFIHPCPQTDSECIKESAKKALPFFLEGNKEFDMESLNPLVMRDVNADTGDLKLKFLEMVLTGTADVKFEKITRNIEKNTINIKLSLPIDITGQYVMSGKMLGVEIAGDGPCHIQCDNLYFDLDARLKIIEKEGKKYYKVVGSDFKFEPRCKSKMHFGNLYDGNKEKAGPVENLIEQQSNELLKTVGYEVIKEAIKKIVKVIDNLFKHISSDQLEIV